MANYSKVLLMGNLTRDPELRYTPQGTPVCDLGLAVNREFGGGGESERRKETVFVDITAWSRRAEVISQYFKKGDPIFIEGRLSMESWETQDGQRRSKLKVTLENFEFIGGGRERGGGRPAGGASDYHHEGGARRDAGARADAGPWQDGSSGADAIDDSEIPF